MTNSSINYQSLSENSSEPNKINNRKCNCNCKCNIWYILYVFLLFTYVNYDVIIVKGLIRVSYEDEQNICVNSNLWLYLLMSLVLNHSLLFVTCIPNEKKNKINQLLPNAGVLVYKLGFSIWGTIIFIHSDNCIKEHELSSLYKIGAIQYMYDVSSFFIILLLSIHIWFKYDKKAEILEEQVVMLARELGQYTNQNGELITSVKI